MKKHEQKLLLKTGLLGVFLALGVATLSWFGQLDPFEHLLSDRRTRWFQYYAVKPTDQIIHLDVDDGSIEAVGRLPWDRDIYSQLIDELTRLDVRVIGLDVTFPDREPARDGVNLDAELAESIRRSGRVVLPVDFDLLRHRGEVERHMVEELEKNLELPMAEVLNILRSEGVSMLNEDFQTLYVESRKTACFNRVVREMDKGPTDMKALRATLLPRTDATVSDSPLLRLLREQYSRALSLHYLGLLARTIPPGLPAAVVGVGERPPIPELAQAAAATAFVDFVRDSDGVVRYLPMWVMHHGRLYPQLGLMLACRQLGVEIADIRLSAEGMVIPRPSGAGGDLLVPLRTIPSASIGGDLAYVMDVPWSGPTKEWARLFGRTDAHIAVTAVWDLVTRQERIRHNNALEDDAIKALYEITDGRDGPKVTQYIKHPPAADDADTRARIATPLLAEAKSLGNLNSRELEADNKKRGTTQPDPDLAKVAKAIDVLEFVPGENKRLQDALKEQSAIFGSRLAGKTVLIGLTASGTLDVVPTPLHNDCPGVVVHGAVFNAILTGEVWRSAPAWAGPAVALALGLLATGAVAFFSPLPALMIVGGLALAYGLVNGLVLFDYGNFLLPPAGPLLSVVVVWAGCTLYSFIVERAERHKITRRFQNYVDPRLVDYILENPDKATLDGEVRVMTVVFTDLANFTTLSERLREETVPMLNEYLSLMIPLVMERSGYVNKFFGDGMMFFFGAPWESHRHAVDAVDSVLAMQQTMKKFNEALTARGLPNVSVRAGVSSGSMVVGNAGSKKPERNDYTVLGNEVNLASRLEGANKATGTRMLVTQTTAEMAGEQFLFRPVAKLQVVGKSEAVMTYEPLARAGESSDHEKELAALTRGMVLPFIQGDFAGCVKGAEAYAQAVGQDKLCELYRKLAMQYLEKPPEAGFDGRILLAEK